MNVAPGNRMQMPLRCDGEEALIKLLSQLEVIECVAMLYEYGSTKSLIGRACDAVIIVSGERDESCK